MEETLNFKIDRAIRMYNEYKRLKEWSLASAWAEEVWRLKALR